MDVEDKLEEIRAVVRSGRPIPMSASSIVNRRELLAALDELGALIPDQLTRAEEVLRDRDAVLERGRVEAAQIVEEGRAERARLLETTDVWQHARRAAEEMRAETEREAAELRREVDDYVDQKLAGFEITLTKTLTSIGSGRDDLPDHVPAIAVGENEELALLRQRAGDQLAATFDRFEAALRKTLDTVARGRERLRDRSGLDAFSSEEEDIGPVLGE